MMHENVKGRLSLFIRLARPSQVSLGENLRGESAIKSVDQIGTPVQYEFRVSHHLSYFKMHLISSLYLFYTNR